MELHNFVEALDEAMEFIAKEYPTSVWEGDVHDFYALLVNANFSNQVFMDYLKHAVDKKVYLPNNVTCVVDKGRVSKVIIGGD